MSNALVPAAALGLPVARRSARRTIRTRQPSAPLPLPAIPFPDLASIPPLYAMKLHGGCLAPDLTDGAEVQFSRDEPIAVGDLCCFVLRPELVSPGGVQCMIKRLSMGLPPYVTLPWTEHPKSDVHALVMAEQLNPRRQFMIKADRLLAIHKFVGVQGSGRDCPTTWSASRR